MAIKLRKNSEQAFINENLEETFTNKKQGKRNYKTLNIPLSKEEYDLLSELADKHDRSRAGLIRYAIRKLDNKTN